MVLMTGSWQDMEFAKVVKNDDGTSFEFWLVIHSSFKNHATGLFINSKGERVKSRNIFFEDNPNQACIDNIFELIVGDLKSKGISINLL